MPYFAIRTNGKTRIHGPCADWKQACLESYKVIDTEFRIKCLGDDFKKVSNEKWLIEQTRSAEGWFRPLLLDSPLGATVLAESALGPDEIVAILRVLAREMLDSMSRAKAVEAWNRIRLYMEYTPSDLNKTLRTLYETKIDGFDKAEAAGLAGKAEVMNNAQRAIEDRGLVQVQRDAPHEGGVVPMLELRPEAPSSPVG